MMETATAVSREGKKRKKHEKKKSTGSKRVKTEKERHREKRHEKERLDERSSEDEIQLNPCPDLFDWRLKREKEKKEGKKGEKPKEEDKERTMKELERLRKQREERDMQKRQWEEERTRQARLREQTYYGELSKKEDEFHLAQAKIRALTRLKENRGKPIDYFYIAIKPENLPVKTVIPSPLKILKPLGKVELLELLQEIPLFAKLHENEEHVQYWNSLLILINHQLEEIGETDTTDEGLHSSVVSDVDSILDGKSERELTDLEKQINQKVLSGEAVDEEYWQSLLKRLRIRRAGARVDEVHSRIVEERLQGLVQKGELNLDDVAELKRKMETGDIWLNADKKYEEKRRELEKEKEREREKKNTEPTLVATGNAFIRSVKKVLTEADMYELEESKGMEEDEEQFSQEFLLPSAIPDSTLSLSSQLPAPGHWIKPKYYNRVKTGYEWNKYNQIHYDVDSPPPKVVQGYKFSIFYPDLIDKSTTPTYRLIPTENPELVILHFKAGPPYLDIAFKIVNGEWEYSQKTGFKCMYSNGILYLWFNFKKYRYRR